MLEIDVFKLKQIELVVFHDDDLDRITNAKGKIEEYFRRIEKSFWLRKHQIPTRSD
jgi:glycerophosphoryl diester phosphodiesterase